MITKILLNIIVFIITILIIYCILKSNSSKYIKICKLFFLILIIWIIFFTTDYTLAKNQKLPIFSTSFFGTFSYQDGGTIEYIGFGYKIIDFHKLVYGLENWENEYKYEKIYICPLTTSYEKAFSKIEQEYLKSKK